VRKKDRRYEREAELAPAPGNLKLREGGGTHERLTKRLSGRKKRSFSSRRARRKEKNLSRLRPEEKEREGGPATLLGSSSV